MLASSLVAALLVGCGRPLEGGKTVLLPAANVRVQTVESKKRVATEEVVGTVRAKLHSIIEAKVSGKIEKMLVVPGQSVKAGELLARLDSRELRARLDQAMAVRQQAENDLKRASTLLNQKIGTQAEFDNAQSKYRVAQAVATEAETLLGYTQVIAPFDGTITRQHADVGDLATPGKPVLEIQDERALRLEADVPESVIGKITLGNKLPVRIPALDTTFEGVVSEIAPAADPVSCTFLVKLDLPSAPNLRAGQFGRVAMPAGETSALRAPASAVAQRGQMEIVFVAADGHAQMRLVKTGKRVGNEVEVVSGLSAGESVVLDGAAQLRDGQPLLIKP